MSLTKGRMRNSHGVSPFEISVETCPEEVVKENVEPKVLKRTRE